MVLVVVMCDVAMVVALVIVTVTLVEGVAIATAVFGRTVDVILDVRIVIASVIIVSVINTERALTAAAGPSPCDPYRQALTMRPSLKARPLVY